MPVLKLANFPFTTIDPSTSHRISSNRLRMQTTQPQRSL
ncbi:uncharacterized protein PAC_02954 [Phialocephala subalpina]|uniref:Uncharacterized protein n=1 Tax=Phialocephala subalpina TaxID=576137 RepID=A0A1L7WJZ4_9HELO|nr:uncharacterized protein PAC_02954 [Phialocephala subalpina]